MIGKRLRPRLEEFLRAQKAQEDRRRVHEELQKVFSRVLQDKVNGLKRIGCKSVIQRFFSEIDSNIDLIKRIKKLLKDLWDFYRKDELFPENLFKIFERFNFEILPEIPQYRDHFIHQLIVYLIGAVIIDDLYDEFIVQFKKAYPQTSAANSEEKNSACKAIELAWLTTALFHDIAYPLQSVGKWFKIFIKEFLWLGYDAPDNYILPMDSTGLLLSTILALTK